MLQQSILWPWQPIYRIVETGLSCCRQTEFFLPAGIRAQTVFFLTAGTRAHPVLFLPAGIHAQTVLYSDFHIETYDMEPLVDN